MCKGKYVRFFCPEAIAQNPLCPHYSATGPQGPMVRAYATLWVQTKWVCCGNHPGDCLDCPELQKPGNIEYQVADALECDDCGARLKAEREAEMEEMGGLDEGEDSDEEEDEDDEDNEANEDDEDVKNDVNDGDDDEDERYYVQLMEITVNLDLEVEIELALDMDLEDDEESEDEAEGECDCPRCEEAREIAISNFQCDCPECSA